MWRNSEFALKVQWLLCTFLSWGVMLMKKSECKCEVMLDIIWCHDIGARLKCCLDYQMLEVMLCDIWCHDYGARPKCCCNSELECDNVSRILCGVTPFWTRWSVDQQRLLERVPCRNVVEILRSLLRSQAQIKWWVLGFLSKESR